MNYYIDVKYTKRMKRTLPYLKKEVVYEIESVCVLLDMDVKPGCMHLECSHGKYLKEAAKAIERFILNCEKDQHSLIRLFGIDTSTKAALFYGLFDEIPYWMPAGIIDLQLWADTYVIPRVDLNKLAEEDKIDFIQTRPLSLQEKKDVIRLHVDYPGDSTSLQQVWKLHKFYTELEKGL